MVVVDDRHVHAALTGGGHAEDSKASICALDQGGSPPCPARDTAQAMSQENVEIVRGIYEAWQQRDFEAALAPFDDDFEWIGPPDISRDESGRAFGLGGMTRSLQRWLENWTDYHYELRELIDHGDHVLAAGWQRGRGRDSGVEVAEDIFSVWTLQNGKVIRQRMFRDRTEALEAAGLQE